MNRFLIAFYLRDIAFNTDRAVSVGKIGVCGRIVGPIERINMKNRLGLQGQGGLWVECLIGASVSNLIDKTSVDTIYKYKVCV